MSVVVHARSEHARGVAAARRLRSRAKGYLARLEIDEAELSIVVVTDAAIRALNRRWRGKDRATDVLSFPAAGPHGALLGDVVVSLDTARRASRAEGRSAAEELDRYLAHGLLHLLGHDHHRVAEARRMASAEDALVGAGMVREALRPAVVGGGARPAVGGEARSATRRTSAAERGRGRAGRRRRP